MTRTHRCPHCGRQDDAPLNVLVHPTSIYTVKCECGESYQYCYDEQAAWKDSK